MYIDIDTGIDLDIEEYICDIDSDTEADLDIDIELRLSKSSFRESTTIRIVASRGLCWRPGSNGKSRVNP